MEGLSLERVELSVERPVSAEQAWAEATSPEGINDELSPWLKMTMPARLRDRDLDDFPVGTPAGRSWILLFGAVPVDYDDLCIVELSEGRFLERSRTLSFSAWEHERVIAPAAADGGAPGCTVTDRLGFELRRPLRLVPGAGSIAVRIVTALFAHRHRRLRRRDTAGR